MSYILVPFSEILASDLRLDAGFYIDRVARQRAALENPEPAGLEDLQQLLQELKDIFQDVDKDVVEMMNLLKE